MVTQQLDFSAPICFWKYVINSPHFPSPSPLSLLHFSSSFFLLPSFLLCLYFLLGFLIVKPQNSGEFGKVLFYTHFGCDAVLEPRMIGIICDLWLTGYLALVIGCHCVNLLKTQDCKELSHFVDHFRCYGYNALKLIT